MIRWLIEKRIAAFEKNYDYDMAYVRELRDGHFPAMRAFLKAASLSQFRGALPLVTWHVARVVASRHAGCGPCLQLVVTLAERAAVEGPALEAALTGDYASLSAEQALVARFVEAVCLQTDAVDDLRPLVIERLGRAGLMSLALVPISAKLYPMLKLALGLHQACGKIAVNTRWISPGIPANNS